MARLTNAATGLAFDLSLLVRENSQSQERAVEQWFKVHIGFIASGNLLSEHSCWYICYLLGSDVDTLCHGLHNLASRTLAEMRYSPFEPAFRMVFAHSDISGFMVSEPWSATITMDLSFLHNGSATGSGPALTLILDAPALVRFAEELNDEYQALSMTNW